MSSIERIESEIQDDFRNAAAERELQDRLQFEQRLLEIGLSGGRRIGPDGTRWRDAHRLLNEADLPGTSTQNWIEQNYRVFPPRNKPYFISC